MSVEQSGVVQLTLTKAELAVVASIVGAGAPDLISDRLGLPSVVSEELGAYALASLVARSFAEVEEGDLSLADELAAIGLCVAAPTEFVSVGIVDDDETHVVRLLASGTLRVALEPHPPLLVRATLLTDEVSLERMAGDLVASVVHADRDAVVALSVERWAETPTDLALTIGPTAGQSTILRTGDGEQQLLVSELGQHLAAFLTGRLDSQRDRRSTPDD